MSTWSRAFEQLRDEEVENRRVAETINYENTLVCLSKPAPQHDKRVPLRILREENLPGVGRLNDELSVAEGPASGVETLGEEIPIEPRSGKGRNGGLRRHQALIVRESVVRVKNPRRESSDPSGTGNGITLIELRVEDKACRLGGQQQLVRIEGGTKHRYQDAKRIASGFRSTHRRLFLSRQPQRSTPQWHREQAPNENKRATVPEPDGRCGRPTSTRFQQAEQRQIGRGGQQRRHRRLREHELAAERQPQRNEGVKLDPRGSRRRTGTRIRHPLQPGG